MWAVMVLAVPAAAGGVAATVAWKRWVGWLCTGAVGVVLVCGVVLAAQVVNKRPILALGGSLRVDALSAFMVIVIGTVGVLATWQGVRYIDNEIASKRSSARHGTLYAVLVQGFITAMLLAVLAGNVGVMWVAVEATTVITTFLVGHRQTRGALEASWKYVIICSVGIAMAFLGTVLVYLAAQHAGAGTHATLDWTSLMSVSHRLNPGDMRLAFALIVLGYGTKVGLAPLHAWLPDAHAEGPTPISAVLSGLLLNVALYAVLRFKLLLDANARASAPGPLMATLGLVSLIFAAFMLYRRRDIKRLFAFSSMEHMGLIALGAAAGTPLAVAAVLLHIMGHGLAKGVLFLTSGEILHVEGTSDIAQVKALLVRRPALGGVFAFGLVALLGLPPFSLFISELNMLRAEVQVGLGWVALITLGCLVVVLAAMMTYARRMLFGARDDAEPVHRTPAVVTAPLIGALCACGARGVLAWPLDGLLRAAAMVVVR